MEKHISKKLFAGILALSAGFVLASCDPVSAVPQNYNHAIVTSSDGEIKLDGNNLGSLYDSITSERNSKIVEDILSQIAEKQFGSYKEFLDACKGGQGAFIRAHSNFFKEDGNENARFETFKEDIEQRISEYFYNEITSGSYNDDLGRFSEKKLYNAHRYELYDLAELEAGKEFALFFVDKELTKENAFDKLNKNLYQVAESGKRGYIQEKVYPDILRNKLVEDYIYENNPSSLGRAYARELRYVKISYDNESRFADALLEKFATTEIEADHSNREDSHIDFSIIENAYKGFRPYEGNGSDLIAPLNATENALFEAAAETINVPDNDNYKFMGITIVPTGDYYKETKLGKILEDYEKAIAAEDQKRFPTEENKSALDSFTSDGKSKQYGLLQKVISLMKEDYTTDGWYVKNGGVTELPSAIRDRLFNIRVANSLDDDSLVLENGSDANHALGAYEYEFDKDGNITENKVTRLPYLRNIFDKKVILPSKSLSFDKDPYNYIYHDVDGKAFYICEVLEAPSTAKLNKESTDYTDRPTQKEEISRQVAKVLGTKDSYIKDAYTKYLNDYVFTFYDTSLYEYFKSEYPDLTQFQD